MNVCVGPKPGARPTIKRQKLRHPVMQCNTLYFIECGLETGIGRGQSPPSLMKSQLLEAQGGGAESLRYYLCFHL